MKLPIQYKSAEEAIAMIRSGDRVFVHGSAQTPINLLHEMARQSYRLTDVELTFISVYGDIEVDKPQYAGSFHINSMFVSASIRQAVNEGRADYIPVFLSEIPGLFRQGVFPLDIAIVQVSPPDKHGYCSLGVSVDIGRAAVNNARYVIAQVNPNVPRTHGDGIIHSSRFHMLTYCEDPLQEIRFGNGITPEEEKIGSFVASLIDDRCTLQMGIGAIPDAVLRSLNSHKNLGVHTEMCSDGIIDLMERDIINNKYKSLHPGKAVVGFALGSRRLYNYVDDNPAFSFLDISYVNDPHVIRQVKKMVAINSAIEVDLTGQVCSDSIGMYQYSGIGGQMDFMRGAALSEGGKPIIAIPSRTAKGLPRITPILKPGAGVVTTRAHVHYVVTEWGIAYLYGKNLRQRAAELIRIAHPDDREMLERAAFDRFKKFESQVSFAEAI